MSTPQTSTPFATIEQEVFVNAQRTADWLMRDLEEVLKDIHLSPTQYNVLRILRWPAPEEWPATRPASG